MEGLAKQRCLNHAAREAVARCPSCSQYYCRECVTEHENKIICAACLSSITAQDAGDSRKRFRVTAILQFTLAILILWIFFFMMGRSLLALPDSFHEGTIWHEPMELD